MDFRCQTAIFREFPCFHCGNGPGQQGDERPGQSTPGQPGKIQQWPWGAHGIHDVNDIGAANWLIQMIWMVLIEIQIMIYTLPSVKHVNTMGWHCASANRTFSAFDHALQANPELLQLHGVFLTSLHSLTSLLWLLCASTEIEAAWFQNMGPRLPWHCVIPGCFCLQHPALSRETEGKRKIHISIYIYIHNTW